MDYPHNDILNTHVGTEDDCPVLCYGNPVCKYWSYSPSKKRCWLKTAKNREAGRKDRVSGNKACGYHEGFCK